MPEQKSKTYKLLPYDIIAKSWMTPAILLIIIGIGLWLGGSYIGLEAREFDPVGIGMAILGAVIVLYAQLAKRTHVSFHKNRLVIHTPLYPIAISYQRIRVARNSEFKRIFPVEKLKRGQVQRYQKLLALTVPVIEVKGLPYPRWYMRLWLHQFILIPNMSALAFPVEDWMGFSRTLDVRRTEWQRSRKRDSDDYYGA